MKKVKYSRLGDIAQQIAQLSARARQIPSEYHHFEKLAIRLAKTLPPSRQSTALTNFGE